MLNSSSLLFDHAANDARNMMLRPFGDQFPFFLIPFRDTPIDQELCDGPPIHCYKIELKLPLAIMMRASAHAHREYYLHPQYEGQPKLHIDFKASLDSITSSLNVIFNNPLNENTSFASQFSSLLLEQYHDCNILGTRELLLPSESDMLSKKTFIFHGHSGFDHAVFQVNNTLSSGIILCQLSAYSERSIIDAITTLETGTKAFDVFILSRIRMLQKDIFLTIARALIKELKYTAYLWRQHIKRIRYDINKKEKGDDKEHQLILFGPNFAASVTDAAVLLEFQQNSDLAFSLL